MRLRLLDRYVLSELLYPFIFGIASFSSIFIASSMLFKLTQYMTKYGASGETIARLFMYSLPEVVNYTFPMSMLLASLMAFGKLSGSSEIVAMKSGGISYYRIVAPVLIVAFFVSMFSVVWAEKVVPAAKVQYGRILEYEIKKNTKPRTQDHVIIKTLSGSTQRITYARRFDEEKGLMENITIEEFEKSHLARIQTAKQAYWENGSIFSSGTRSMSSRRTVVWRECGTMNTSSKPRSRIGFLYSTRCGNTPKSFFSSGTFSMP